jgi:hypothetical protein
MIVYMLSDFTNDINFGPSVSCFDFYYNWREKNIDMSVARSRGGFMGPYRHAIEVFSTSKIKDESLTDFRATFFTWFPPSLDELYEIDNNFKHIVVTCKSKDLLTAEANYFYQQKMDGLTRKRKHFWNTYCALADKKLLQNNSVNNLEELPVSDVRVLLEEHIIRETNLPGDIVRQHPTQDLMVDSKIVIPEKYKSNVTLIDFEDIINDKHLALSMLENITNKHVTKDVERNYDRYVFLQKQIYNNYVSKILSISVPTK